MSHAPGKTNDLLTTKLDIPSLGNIIVRRDRLYRQLGYAGDRRVTLMVAPAGYGKTTLLVEWLSTIPKTRQHTAWVNLDPFDNSPLQFWSYICAAVQKIYSHFNFNTKTMLPLEYDLQDFKEVIPLINALAKIPFRFNLVLDDFQSIEHEYILQSVQYLIEHQPKNLHLIVATRSRPPLTFSRIRIQNRLVELSTRELSFTFNETNTFLTGISGLTVSYDQMQALQKATEGWIAGLQMAVLSMQRQPEFKYPNNHLPDENDRVFAYLAEEVLNHLDAQMQQFLLKTSILPDLCAPLCDTVLQRTDSQEFLDRIEQENLFLSSLDPMKRWYRYHPLFANAMAYHLTQSAPDEISTIHRAACDWLCQNGYTDKAVSHALAVGDIDTAAWITDACALQAIKTFDMDSLIHWTNRLSLDLISQYPKLGIYRAVACFQLTLLDQVEPELQRVEHALETRRQTGRKDDDTVIHWEIAAIRAVMVCTHSDIRRGIQAIHEVQQYTPLDDPYFSGWLDHSLANAYHALGDLESAIHHYEAGRQFATRHQMIVGYMVSTATLANLYKRQGKLQQAEEECLIGLDFARDKKSISWLTSLLYSYRMEIDLERSSYCAVDERLNELVSFIHQKENERTSTEHQIALYLSMANCFLLCRDTQQAELYLNFAREKLSKTIDSVVFNRFLADMVDIQSGIWKENGKLKMLDTGFADGFPGSESSPLIDVSIQTTLSRIYLLQCRYEDALKTLEALEADIRKSGIGRSLIEILLLKALSHAALEEEEKAFTHLTQAIDLARPEGYLRVFLDEGEAARLLFERYAAVCREKTEPPASPSPLSYIHAVINAFAQERVRPHINTPSNELQPSILTPLQESLTGREQDVYDLLLNGKTTKEIAAALTISINTAKTHVWNIQRKLS